MRNEEHLYDELKRLKKELDRVTQERDLLKKAAAYFAKESR
jgi:transposase